MSTKKLRRSNQSVIGGVCAGMAEFFDLDVSLIRIIWALAVLAFGTGVLAYLIAWLIIPAEQIDSI
ncbi:MAG: PspC domain-containing protein [Paludibacteraceae bacterium]|nr:PspC domain-containing protein [Paludibacteraceae bacterium]MBP6284951.1 PspC domain-containing protein [Paludibacteraceae bacterium]